MVRDKSYWTIGSVIAEFATDAEWWYSTRQLNAIEDGIKFREKEAHKILRESRAGDYRDVVCDFTADAIRVRSELRERKAVLSMSDDKGEAWKRCVIRILKRDFGEDVWKRINQEARAHVEELTALRSTPMGTGSVLGPISGGGGVKTR